LNEKYNIDRKLLSRFISDTCSEEEKHAVLEWLADPSNKLLAQQWMEDHWRSTADEATDLPFDVEKMLTRTSDKIIAPAVRRERKTNRYRWSLAAVWLGALIVFSGLLFFLSQRSQNPLPPDAAPVAAADDVEEVRSASGQIVEKILPDGTRVTLNAQSSLVFAADFSNRATREVELKGEAFFDVAEDKAHPFIVKTQRIRIVVLGTAFNLKSYEGDPTIETTLIRGKVVIEKNEDASGRIAELHPNQKAVFSNATEQITLTNVSLKNDTPWSRESLDFEDDLLYDVIKSLERWYDVTIHVRDASSLNCRFTARIDKESLHETLEILKSLTGIRYTVSGREVFIEGTICEP
jgi:ferric-dicitrate binding protein FerR (iron transport regulator)